MQTLLLTSKLAQLILTLDATSGNDLWTYDCSAAASILYAPSDLVAPVVFGTYFAVAASRPTATSINDVVVLFNYSSNQTAQVGGRWEGRGGTRHRMGGEGGGGGTQRRSGGEGRAEWGGPGRGGGVGERVCVEG